MTKEDSIPWPTSISEQATNPSAIEVYNGYVYVILVTLAEDMAPLFFVLAQALYVLTS